MRRLGSLLEDGADGRGNGVSGKPTVYIDGIRYDGAWGFHWMLEAIERPASARVERSARAFACLLASGGLVRIAAAASSQRPVDSHDFHAAHAQAFQKPISRHRR